MPCFAKFLFLSHHQECFCPIRLQVYLKKELSESLDNVGLGVFGLAGPCISKVLRNNKLPIILFWLGVVKHASVCLKLSN